MAERAARPVVWVIDSQQWPRACLRAELIERGFEAVGYAEPARPLEALRQPDGVKPGIIVLELRGLAPRRDELRALARAGIPTVLLGGAVELNEDWVGEFQWAAVMRRPLAIDAVVEAVEELLEGGTLP